MAVGGALFAERGPARRRPVVELGPEPGQAATVLRRRMTVGRADDPAERQADAAADRVVATLRSAGGATVAASESARRAPAARIRPSAPVGAEGGALDTDTTSRVQRALSSGRPLDAVQRSRMEGAFGADLASVRVHDGAVARRLNDDLQASAFTVGSHVFFRDGVPAAGDRSGDRLMAHELAHTMQPDDGARRQTIRRSDVAWGTASAASAPGGGAKGGIFFVTVGTTRHVVKATDAPGAAVFGEAVVGQVMGAEGAGANSEAIRRGTPEHTRIIASIRANKPTEAGDEFDERLAWFERAAAILVQSDLGAGRQTLKSNVAGDIAMLGDTALLERVGRMLAADTLIGNADRFEQMNTGNAFMGANDIGFIDTEALMQQQAAFKAFSAQGQPGQDFGAASLGTSDRDAYVKFLLNGGREISDKQFHEAGVAPSSRAGMVGDPDRFLESTFISGMLAGRDGGAQQALADAGYPGRFDAGYAESKWRTEVLPALRRGFDAGMVRVTSMATTPVGVADAKERYDAVANQPEAANFDFDAFLIRGQAMSGLAAGKDVDTVVAEGVAYLESLERPSAAIERADAVIAEAEQQGWLTKGEGILLRYYLPSVDESQLRDRILHVRGGKAKFVQKAAAKITKFSTDLVDRRLEAVRAHLLRYFLQADPHKDVDAAARTAAARAAAVHAADVYQSRYATKGGLRAAQQALNSIGMNGALWITH